MDPIYLLTLLRLLIPLLILRWPLVGILLSAFLDSLDWKLFPFEHSTDYHLYQIWDKSLDLYYGLIAFFVTFKWRDHTARKIVQSLFIYRLVGLGLFFTFDWRPALFFFPNLFENFFFFYHAFLHFTKQPLLLTSKRIAFLILISILLPKLIHEYFLHFLGHQPWELHNVGQYLGLQGIAQEEVNLLSWGLLMYAPSLLALVVLIRRRRNGGILHPDENTRPRTTIQSLRPTTDTL
ncbi:MAG TPA: hypothetical protein VF209_03010 [Patescibacteria group bacterium]